jgi:hypothetical protein
LYRIIGTLTILFPQACLVAKILKISTNSSRRQRSPDVACSGRKFVRNSDARDCYISTNNVEISAAAQKPPASLNKKNRYREAKVDVTKSLTHNYLGTMAVTTPSQPGWLFMTCLTPVCRILAGPLSLHTGTSSRGE